MSEAILNPVGDDVGSAADLSRRMLRMRLAVVEAVSLDSLVEIMRKLVQRAVDGCFQSMKLVLNYTIGRAGATQSLMKRHGDAAALPAAPTPVTKRQETAPVDPPLFTSEEFQEMLRQPLASSGREDARNTSVLSGKATVNKR